MEMDTITTAWHKFVGTNERGTPPMPRNKVLADLAYLVTTEDVDSFVVCEFKWDYYWEAAEDLLSEDWKSSPPMKRGKRFPVVSAQAVFWRKDIYRKIRTRLSLAHLGVAGISETRFIRSVLLADVVTDLRHWELITHFVVGGDEEGDGEKRKKMLRKNIRRLDRHIAARKRSGQPIIGQLDANIHKGTWAYDELMEVFRKHDARVVGVHGVEYLFVIDGRTTKVEVKRDFDIKPKRNNGPLETDHEARGLIFRLVKKVRSK